MNLKVGQIMYWTRVHPQINIFDLYDLQIRTLYDTYFACVDKRTKQSYVFSYNDVNKTIFINRDEALVIINKLEGK